MRLFSLLPATVVAAVCCDVSVAELITIGPGDVSTVVNDHQGDIIAIDLTPQLVSAGNHTVSTFNYESKTINPGLAGTLQPMLATGSGTSFTVIALGDIITYSGDTGGFVSSAFGGSDTFTLASNTNVFAGVYWDEPGGGRMPVGFASGGSSWVRYNPSTGSPGGAHAPTVGNPISGGTGGGFARTYDFSVTIGAVPEPSSFAFISVCAIGFGFRRRKRRPSSALVG